MSTVTAPESPQAPTKRPPRTPTLVRVAAALITLVWLAVGGLGGPRIGQLSGLQENDSGSFLPASAESSLASEEAAAFSEADSLPLLLVLTRTGGFETDQMTAVGTFVSELADLAIADGLTLSDVLVEEPTAAIPAEDGEAVLIPLALDAESAREDIEDASTIRVVMDAVAARAADDLGAAGIAVAQTGPAAYVADFSTAFAGIDGVLLLVALAVVFVILVLVYRSPFLPFAVLSAAVLGLSAAGFIVYELVSRGYLSVSGQSQGILSILVVGAATDYALLIVSRYREELHHTVSAWQAMMRTWRGTVEPISASGATVVAGLLCLLLSDLGSTRSLGPIAAAGIVGALLGALTFLPAVLVLAGRRIFWPRIPQVDAPTDEATTGGWTRVAGFVGRHARAVWIGATVLLVACAAFVPTFKADGLGNNEVFRVDVPSVTGEAVLTEHFPAGATTPITVVAPTDEAEAVVTAATDTPGVEDASVRLEAGPPPGIPGAPEPAPMVVDDAVLVEITL
ncbi:MAG: MMPL family transporter, partial [Propioniciclava sp.]